MNGERSPVASLVSSKPKYQLTFDTLFVDFGKIRRGEKREYTYRFQNTGTDPVVIDIVTSCDCTTLTWPEAEVIKPGARNQIHAVFDSTEKEQSETVDIDVILQQKNEKGHPILYILQYKFELE